MLKFRTHFLILLVTVSAMVFLLISCQPTTSWTRYEVCLGLTRNNGQIEITEEEFNTFLIQEVMPRFNEGFTIYDTQGFWKGGDRGYTERSKVFMVVAPTTLENREKITAIMKAYKEQFEQESVLEIMSPVQVTFY